MYGIFGRKITIHTVIYGVIIRFWPTLYIANRPSHPNRIQSAIPARWAFLQQLAQQDGPPYTHLPAFMLLHFILFSVKHGRPYNCLKNHK